MHFLNTSFISECKTNCFPAFFTLSFPLYNEIQVSINFTSELEQYIDFIAILFTFPWMFKTNMFHIT
jgi:hypothetical protein